MTVLIVDDQPDVVRGEEWLSTLPWHLELWRACGFRIPRFSHTAQVMKLDEETGTKRKMSKRKDPESSLEFYFEKGYPAKSVIDRCVVMNYFPDAANERITNMWVEVIA
mgnify:CR=1 FL=1